MKQTTLGRSGLIVSELALGTMTFGKEADEAEARRILGAYLDAGGFVLDTADSYVQGRSEEILGRLIAGRRAEMVVMTKARFPTGPGPNNRGASRRHLLASVEGSLRRLRTDWIDVFVVHCWDPRTPLDETLSTLDSLVRAGTVRYLAASNFAAWQLAKALGLAELRRLEPFRSVQLQYSLASRSIERELLPLCRSEQLGVVAWSPLGGGLLTGKYAHVTGSDGTPPPDTALPEGTRAADSARRGSQTMRNRFTPQNAATVAVLRELADAYGWSPAQIAVAWVVRQPSVTSTLLGARTAAQLRHTMAALECRLPDEAWQRLAEVSAPPPEYPYDFLEYAETV